MGVASRPGRLAPEKEPQLPIAQGSSWASEPVWMLLKTKIKKLSASNQISFTHSSMS
jgi:hypothetical protein